MEKRLYFSRASMPRKLSPKTTYQARINGNDGNSNDELPESKFQESSRESHLRKRTTTYSAFGLQMPPTNSRNSVRSQQRGFSNDASPNERATTPVSSGGLTAKEDNVNKSESKRRVGNSPVPSEAGAFVLFSPLFYLSGANGTRIVELHLLSKGWRRTSESNSNFRLKWVESKLHIRYKMFREGEQMVNHLPSSWYLSNKIRLVALLRELDSHQRRGLLRMNDILPETYRLDLVDEHVKFRERYRGGQVWICKPAALNQGKGIYLIRQLEDFDRRFQSIYTSGSNIHLPLRIVQRYIGNPLLLSGRKADIRGYMLIASSLPFLVLFHPGYVRLSCSQYDALSDDLRTHLTNQYVQKKDPRYGAMKEDTIWSMDQLNNYMNEQILNSRGLQPNWVRMRRVMLHCFLAAKNRLETRVGYFELLGFDFLIDNDLKIWLLEININPALCTDCSVLQDLIPSVIRETLDISIECFEKNRRNLPLLPLQNAGGFALLYCGERNTGWQANAKTIKKT